MITITLGFVATCLIGFLSGYGFCYFKELKPMIMKHQLFLRVVEEYIDIHENLLTSIEKKAGILVEKVNGAKVSPFQIKV